MLFIDYSLLNKSMRKKVKRKCLGKCQKEKNQYGIEI